SIVARVCTDMPIVSKSLSHRRHVSKIRRPYLWTVGSEWVPVLNRPCTNSPTRLFARIKRDSRRHGGNMASYRGHLMTSTALGVVYGGLSWNQLNVDWPIAAVGGILTAV